MLVLLNGKLTPEEEAVTSVFDRGFLYGDGLFETLPILKAGPEHWQAHYERLSAGARFLRIPLSVTSKELCQQSASLLQANKQRQAILRIQLTRGIGPRGYAPPASCSPTLVMTLHSLPEQPDPIIWRAILSSQRLDAQNPLNRYKTCNRLPHILAKMEAVEEGVDEAMLMNHAGQVVEGSGSNFFCVIGKAVITPPISTGALPGVTRSLVLGLCRELHIPCQETPITEDLLHQAEGAFSTLSTLGIVSLRSVGTNEYEPTQVAGQLQKAYGQLRL